MTALSRAEVGRSETFWVEGFRVRVFGSSGYATAPPHFKERETERERERELEQGREHARQEVGLSKTFRVEGLGWGLDFLVPLVMPLPQTSKVGGHRNKSIKRLVSSETNQTRVCLKMTGMLE